MPQVHLIDSLYYHEQLHYCGYCPDCGLEQRNLVINKYQACLGCGCLFNVSPAQVMEDLLMIDIAKLKVGDKVCYQPAHYGADKYENGLVKEMPDHTNTSIRVVYNCAGNWDKFMDYTSALTQLSDLTLGWKH